MRLCRRAAAFGLVIVAYAFSSLAQLTTVPALPPAFDTAISARIEQTRLSVAIPIDLNWGLP
jgi:hypothetical protein